MRLIWKYVSGQFRRRWFASLLVVAALTASVSMVMVVVAGEDIVMGRSIITREQAGNVLGRFQLLVRSAIPQIESGAAMRAEPGQVQPEFKPAILQWLRGNSDIAYLTESCQADVDVAMDGSNGRGLRRPLFGLINPTAQPPYPMYAGRWLSGNDSGEIVVDWNLASRVVRDPNRPQFRGGGPTSRPTTRPTGAPGGPRRGGLSGAISDALSGNLTGGPRQGGPGQAERLPTPPANTVGASFQITTETDEHDIKICGVLKTPPLGRRDSYGLGGFYVSAATFQDLTGQPAKTSRVMIELKDGVSVERFARQLAEVAEPTGQRIQTLTAEDLESDANVAVTPQAPSVQRSMPFLHNAAMGLAVLTAVFIIFSTLSMGLAENGRRLAMLRVVGMTRLQILSLIVAEMSVLTFIGWGLGAAAGWAMMKGNVADPVIRSHVHIPLWFEAGALSAFAATFAAAAVPTLLAIRRRPLEGMRSSTLLTSRSLPLWLAPLALCLIALNPLVTLTTIVPEAWRTTAMPLSCVTAIAGFAMLTPLIILLCERLFFGRVAGFIFGLDHRLLDKQMSAGLWRTVGCTTALTVGLGLYLTIQIWGLSMTTPFLTTDRSPDAVVVTTGGILAQDLPAIQKLNGVTNVVPMIVQHPLLADLPAHVEVGEALNFTKRLILLGCDVDALTDAKTGLYETNFVRGNARDAAEQLKSGNSCLITDSFYLRAPEHYDVGKTIEMSTPGGTSETVKYNIAGVVEMPGWQILSNRTHLRNPRGRVGGLVIVPVSTATAHYPEARFQSFWFNLQSGTVASSLEAPIEKLLDPSGKATTAPTTARSRNGGFGGGRRRGGGGGNGDQPYGGSPDPMLENPYTAIVTDTKAMTRTTMAHAEDLVQGMTLYPLLALGLSSLAVAGTMIASVRSRAWEFGVLRSVGITRSQVLRQVLAEGLLIAALSCVISILFAIPVSWTGIRFASVIWNVNAPFVVPAGRLLTGVVAAAILCLAASMWPALAAAFRRPLRLLQDGRMRL